MKHGVEDLFEGVVLSPLAVAASFILFQMTCAVWASQRQDQPAWEPLVANVCARK